MAKKQNRGVTSAKVIPLTHSPRLSLHTADDVNFQVFLVGTLAMFLVATANMGT